MTHKIKHAGKYKNTLIDINFILHEIKVYLDTRKANFQPDFADALYNYLSCYRFTILAHQILTHYKTHISPLDSFTKEYFNIYRISGFTDEYTRFSNIGGLLILFKDYEYFFIGLYKKLKIKLTDTEKTKKLENLKMYKKILKCKIFDKKLRNKMIDEFNLIRFSRNSLQHNDGIFKFKTRVFNLDGKKYPLIKGKQIVPLRIIKVAEILWKHYVELNDS